jgi:hypothetical protein
MRGPTGARRVDTRGWALINSAFIRQQISSKSRVLLSSILPGDVREEKRYNKLF